MAKREPKPEELGYEQAVEQLEGLIERIESGEIGLEESLKQYETGMALIKRCRAILATAEAKITELTVTSAGAADDADDALDAEEDDAEADDDADEDSAEDDDEDDLPI